MVNVCVQHFDLYKLPKSKLTNVNILCLARFWPEQITAVTDLVAEQWRRDSVITNHYYYDHHWTKKTETLKKACFLIWSAPRLPRRLAGSRISSCRMKLVAAAENDFGNIMSPRRIRLQFNSNIISRQSPNTSIKIQLRNSAELW